MADNPAAGMFSPREKARKPFQEECKVNNAAAAKGQRDGRESARDGAPRSSRGDSQGKSLIGKHIQKQATLAPESQKKRALHIYDFKKFKYMR